MQWTKLHSLTGFYTMLALYRSGLWILAKWDHEHCRGWLLYKIRRPSRADSADWVASAGPESLSWSDEEAQRWAEKIAGQAGG
jgi:hypothetical protein